MPRPARWKRKPSDEKVAVLDVSASGLSVVAPTVDELPVRSVVPIRHGRHATRTVVRRVEPTDDPAITRYGLQFLDDPSPDLIDDLLSYAGAEPRQALEDTWRRSR